MSEAPAPKGMPEITQPPEHQFPIITLPTDLETSGAQIQKWVNAANTMADRQAAEKDAKHAPRTQPQAVGGDDGSGGDKLPPTDDKIDKSVAERMGYLDPTNNVNGSSPDKTMPLNNYQELSSGILREHISNIATPTQSTKIG